jgi:NAD(P)H-flavin reductase
LNSTKDDQFYITGPVSKGFDLSRDNIAGTNLIFVGGTGVNPFVDLFAYLARRLIKEKMGQNTPFPDELYEDYMQNAKFVVYAYYPRPADAVALEF